MSNLNPDIDDDPIEPDTVIYTCFCCGEIIPESCENKIMALGTIRTLCTECYNDIQTEIEKL